jgi:hypothetical protein
LLYSDITGCRQDFRAEVRNLIAHRLSRRGTSRVVGYPETAKPFSVLPIADIADFRFGSDTRRTSHPSLSGQKPPLIDCPEVTRQRTLE